ncbi:carbohydrate ABC transporter permease [Candidatus Aerophobetes bacterium]|nr:carbohydrate ABC transporter permease [Candidatus Aerophobetes bacterium]
MRTEIYPSIWKGLKILALLVVIILAITFLMPLYWMVTGSFKVMTATYVVPPDLFPKNPTIENYIQLLFRNIPSFRWLTNSFIVAGGATILIILFSSLAGYSFAKKRFPGRTILFWLLLATIMLPLQVTFIPLFILMRRLNLFNTLLGMLLPGVAWPFGIFLMRQFIQTIPSEIIDAGRIDGASEIGIWWRIIIPLSKPALGALGIFSFMGVWNDYMWQLVMAKDVKMMTLPVGVSGVMRGQTLINYGLGMAGATFAFIPMLVIFLVFQSYFVKGLTMGAVKG